jgi:hypothetical protein
MLLIILLSNNIQLNIILIRAVKNMQSKIKQIKIEKNF